MKCRPLIRIFAGKTLMAKTIVSLIEEKFPGHLTYVELFSGGGSVYFRKEPARTNIINDINGNFCTTYMVFKENKEEIVSMLQNSLYGREFYRKSIEIYRNPDNYTPVEIAWATIYGYAVGFRRILGATFSSYPRTVVTSPSEFSIFRTYVDTIECQADKLRHACIENLDAIKCLKKYDREQTLFYCDPPYINTDCSGLGEYTQEDFINLLEELSSIKGKFILSCFDNIQIREFLANNTHCNVTEYVKQSNMQAKKGRSGKKTELIVTNL